MITLGVVAYLIIGLGCLALYAFALNELTLIECVLLPLMWPFIILINAIIMFWVNRDTVVWRKND